MIIKGFLDIKEDSERIPFSIIDDKVEIITEFDIRNVFGKDKVMIDKVFGKTSDNRDIIFLDVIYNGINFVPTGWVISNNNLSNIDIDTFDAIRFTGKPIDVFHSPKIALEHEKLSGEIIGKRMSNIFCKPFESYVKRHFVIVEDEEFNLIFDVHITYDLDRSSRSIGEVTTSLMLQFKERKKIEQIKRYYLYMLDFFRFINFRRNIEFDSITTLHKTDRGLEKRGRAYFNSHDFGQKYNSSGFNSIIYSDLENYFDVAFANICERRAAGIINQAYIPENDRDFRMVDPIKFLSCALTFEGEHKRKFGKSRKWLSVKYNETIEYYKTIVEQYIEKVIKEENADSDDNIDLGVVLSNMRNAIGHGEIIPIERKHVAVFRITQCLIYVLILDKSGVDWSVIKNIINKLF